MSLTLDPIYSQQGPANIPLSVSLEANSTKEIWGVLHLAKSGYVYSAPSKAVVWIKFLALGLYLPLQGIASKCAEIARCCFGCATPRKGFHDLHHTFHLSQIAWKGALGRGPLLERVEEFAFAEIDYNHLDRGSALALNRSTRFSKGHYIAPCMQPLFHQSEAIPLSFQQRKVEALKGKKEAIDQEIAYRQASTVQTLFQSLFSQRSYEKVDQNKLEAMGRSCSQMLSQQEIVLERSRRCNRYAAQAILNQNCCVATQAKIRKQVVQTDAEISCGGQICFKQERICGIIYKIDCCFTRCWAIDCLCCVCCFWPEGRSFCILG